jgi:hypothetical protein
MAALVAAINVLVAPGKAWMVGTSPAMTPVVVEPVTAKTKLAKS